jgi:hypothetical protein
VPLGCPRVPSKHTTVTSHPPGHRALRPALRWSEAAASSAIERRRRACQKRDSANCRARNDDRQRCRHRDAAVRRHEQLGSGGSTSSRHGRLRPRELDTRSGGSRYARARARPERATDRERPSSSAAGARSRPACMLGSGSAEMASERLRGRQGKTQRRFNREKLRADAPLRVVLESSPPRGVVVLFTWRFGPGVSVVTRVALS